MTDTIRVLKKIRARLRREANDCARGGSTSVWGLDRAAAIVSREIERLEKQQKEK